MDHATRDRIEELVNQHRLVLFMKGNRNFPMCGFSAKVVGILKEVGVEFETVNVLADPAVREGIKEYGNWPTIPQLYVDGELVGGCDIVSDLYASGELPAKLGR
jgi:monothiol glutaredoxin